MFEFPGLFLTIYLIAALAAVVLLFWLVITAIRALNIYIAKNRTPRTDQQ